MGVRRELQDVTKLPKWAQDHIEHLTMERNAATRTLNAFVDNETPTACWFEEHPCTGEATGPQRKRHYVQTNDITMLLGKEEITMRLSYTGDSISISSGWNRLVIRPASANQIEILEEKR